MTFKPDDRWIVGSRTLHFQAGKPTYRCCIKLDHPLNCDHGEEALEILGENYSKSPDDKELKEKVDKLRESYKEKKMPENNMYDAIYSIYNTLHYELGAQGVDDESINKVMDDLLESMNRNIKWELKKD
jgi:hypothetical protein